MLVSIHILLSLFAAWALYPAIGWYAIIFFFAGFLIDIDHYIEYAVRHKVWNPWIVYRHHMIEHYVALNKIASGKPLLHEKRVHAFHMIEVIITVGIIGLLNDVFLFVFFGMVFHVLLDVVSYAHAKWQHGNLIPCSGRHYSLVWYLLKR